MSNYESSKMIVLKYNTFTKCQSLIITSNTAGCGYSPISDVRWGPIFSAKIIMLFFQVIILKNLTS